MWGNPANSRCVMLVGSMLEKAPNPGFSRLASSSLNPKEEEGISGSSATLLTSTKIASSFKRTLASSSNSVTTSSNADVYGMDILPNTDIPGLAESVISIPVPNNVLNLMHDLHMHDLHISSARVGSYFCRCG